MIRFSLQENETVQYNKNYKCNGPIRRPRPILAQSYVSIGCDVKGQHASPKELNISFFYMSDRFVALNFILQMASITFFKNVHLFAALVSLPDRL